MAEVNEVEVKLAQPPRQSRLRQSSCRLQDGITFKTIGSRDILSYDQQYKVNLYYLLDAVISEMKLCFNKNNLDMMKAISSFNPHSETFLNASSLKLLAITYNLDYESLSMEVTLAKRTLANCQIENVHDVFIELYPLKSAFPNLFKLVQISMTIVVSTAHCE